MQQHKASMHVILLSHSKDANFCEDFTCTNVIHINNSVTTYKYIRDPNLQAPISHTHQTFLKFLCFSQMEVYHIWY